MWVKQIFGDFIEKIFISWLGGFNEHFPLIIHFYKLLVLKV